MADEKTTGAASTKTPARPQLMPAPTWMVYGMGLAMLTIFVRILWFTARGDWNGSLATAVWVIAVGVGVPALLNCRQGWKRILGVCSASLYTSALMAGMILFLTGSVAVEYFQDTPKVEQFASQDFDQFAVNGQVSPAQLEQTLNTQAELRSQLAALDGVHKTLDSTAADVVAKTAADAGVAVVETELKMQLLPDDQVERMRVVNKDLWLIAPKDTPVSKAQLANYGQTMHAKFGFWEWILRTVHAL